MNVNIYLTEILTGKRMGFPMVPDKIKIAAGARFTTFHVLNLGEVKMPSGAGLKTASWSGVLPGEGRRTRERMDMGDAGHVARSARVQPAPLRPVMPAYIKSEFWDYPKKIESQWDMWKANKTRLRLMVTNTGINFDVYLDNYTATPVGGFGDHEYTINFVEARSLRVYTIEEQKDDAPAREDMNERPPGKGNPKTYTVKDGDSLWALAERFLGKGSRYMEIYELNKAVIGSDPRRIRPGMVLKLPEK